MEKNTMKILLASTMIMLGAGVALAQEQRGEGMTFETLDVDGSGEITLEDLTALRDNRFAELDSNGDGSISQDEFVAHQVARSEERAARMFERLDADGDGTLSRDVIENEGRGRSGERMISRFDEDNSGGISAEEFEEAKARIGERRKGGKGGHGQKRN
ncbi:MAG: EF-hand domain-containing protein [Pseudomonadota bacterium]